MNRLPFLTPMQRRALLILEWLLLLGIVGMYVWAWRDANVTDNSDARKPGVRRSDPIIAPYYYANERHSPETFPFDPNTADSTTLLRLGFTPRQVRSIYHYRAVGGRYHKTDDFMRLPGLTYGQWDRLKPYIRIAKQFQLVHLSYADEGKGETGKKTKGSNAHEGEVANAEAVPAETGGAKLRIGEVIDINTADTSQLKSIPGIASKRAARIVAYRQALGGFVDIGQAMEAAEMPDEVLNYMTLSTQPVRKMNVNELSVKELMRHPYVNFYQAKAIDDYRRNEGKLHSIETLRRMDAFRPTDIERLLPYVEF